MFHQNPTRVTGALHEHLCSFMIVSRLIILRMRNVSGKRCGETQNTHCMLSNLVTNIVSFMR
jgi:hypothetical protein